MKTNVPEEREKLQAFIYAPGISRSLQMQSRPAKLVMWDGSARGPQVARISRDDHDEPSLDKLEELETTACRIMFDLELSEKQGRIPSKSLGALSVYVSEV